MPNFQRITQHLFFPKVVNVAAFFFLYVLCWKIYKDYGVSIDEPLHLTRVPLYFHQWKQIFTNGYVENVSGGMRYGVIFNLIAHPFITTFSKNTRFLLEAYEIKHIVTFHVYFLTYIAIAFAFCKAFNYRYSVVLAVLILTLLPNLFGQSFFNPKDIPFAAFFTFASVMIAYRTYIISNKISHNIRHSLFFDALLFSFLIILASGVRIAGLVIIPAWLLLIITDKNFYKNKDISFKTCTLLALTGFFTAVMLLLVYPSAISNPLRWIDTTIHYFNNGTGFGERTNFVILVTIFLKKIPIIWLCASIIGVGLFIRRFLQLPLCARHIGTMLLLQIIAIPALMLIMGTRTYHEERHFLLSYPPLAFFSGYALVSIYKLLRKAHEKYLYIGVIALFSANIAKEMVALHPYQYVYINEFVRYSAAQLIDVKDYWGLSRKPILEWLVKNSRDRHKITTQIWYAFAPNSIANNLYGRKRFTYSHFSNGIYIGAWRQPKGCNLLYTEQRMLGNVPLYLGNAFDCRNQPAQHRISDRGPRIIFNKRGKAQKNKSFRIRKSKEKYNFFTPEL